MSFQRIGGTAPKKKVLTRRKPGWDDSVHDLTVYRATPDEILMRKEAHKSKNHMCVKLEKMRKEQQRARLTGSEAQQLAIMKEVLYDQQQLQKVVAKSDRMMAVVKDLFGDDPKRFTGFPNVTTAPKSLSSVSNSLVTPVPDIYTKTEKLSESVMNTSALNDDVDISTTDDDEEVDQPGPISYESKLNLLKFQQFLQEEEAKSVQQDPHTLISQQDQNSSNNNPSNNSGTSEGKANVPSDVLQIITKALSEKELDAKQGLLSQDPRLMSSLMTVLADGNNNGLKTPPKSQQSHHLLASEHTPPSAINDTKKVKKTKKHSTSAVIPGEASNSSMADMRQALQDLEKELCAYEHQVGHCSQEEKNKTETFSGYTVALVSAVSRLSKYLKETELRVRTEMTLREQLTEDVLQMRTIIDALATDIIMTQEEYAKLYAENHLYRETTTKIIHELKNEMQEMKNLLPDQSPRETSSENAGQNRLYSADKNESEKFKTSSPSPSSQGNSLHSARGQPPTSKGSKTIMPAAAIMLSPPVRKTRVANDTRGTRNVPDLSHAPSVMESINVPKPIPLVQSNLPIDLASVTPPKLAASPNDVKPGPMEASIQDLVKLGDRTQEQLNHLQEMAVEEALKNPALQDLMQTQIVELNRQQEEARKRLQDLLANQKLQQQHFQEQLGINGLLEGDLSSLNCYVPQKMSQDQVSPPISPISQGSEKLSLRGQDGIRQVPRGQGIILSLPMVDLDVSTGSLASPPPEPLAMKLIP